MVLVKGDPRPAARNLREARGNGAGPAGLLQPTTDLGVFIAALTISSIIPIALFLVFQRLFLRGEGLGGALKG